MNQPPQPPEKYCRICGGEMRVLNVSRVPVSGLPGHMQWSADMVCSKCGLKDGVSWNALRPASELSPSDPLRHRLQQHERPKYLGTDGRIDLAVLVHDYSFPVFGLKGQPLGLRLRSPGWGSSIGRGMLEPVYSIELGYVAGNPREPEKALSLSQNRPLPELDSVEHVVENYCSQQLRNDYLRDGNFHRDWNEEQISKASRQHTTVHVGGQPVEVELASWEQPQQVVLAQLELGGHPATAAALNLSPPELLEALGTLVALQEDKEALDQHQQDFDENWREIHV